MSYFKIVLPGIGEQVDPSKPWAGFGTKVFFVDDNGIDHFVETCSLRLDVEAGSAARLRLETYAVDPTQSFPRNFSRAPKIANNNRKQLSFEFFTPQLSALKEPAGLILAFCVSPEVGVSLVFLGVPVATTTNNGLEIVSEWAWVETLYSNDSDVLTSNAGDKVRPSALPIIPPIVTAKVIEVDFAKKKENES